MSFNCILTNQIPSAAEVGAKPSTWMPTASEVGLGNVDNTSDVNKPVSTAQATAIADAKSEIISTINNEFIINGNGYLKNNTNFNRLEFDSSKTNNSFGSFKVPVNEGYTAYTDLMPIDNTKDYLFSMDAITQNGQATLFGRIEYFDANDNSLSDSGYVGAWANIPSSSSWTTYSAIIAATDRPAATTQIRIHWLFNHLAVDDYIWITNVKFKAIEYATVEELDEVKKSVSDGKALIAEAITEKGIETAADAEFAIMAENIRSL